MNVLVRDLPGGVVVKNPPSNAGDMVPVPGQGLRSQAPCLTTEPVGPNWDLRQLRVSKYLSVLVMSTDINFLLKISILQRINWADVIILHKNIRLPVPLFQVPVKQTLLLKMCITSKSQCWGLCMCRESC